MSFGSVLSASVRTLVLAAATGAAALGLLVVFHPFAAPAAPGTVVIDTSNADALKQQIEAARNALARTEAALDNVNSQSTTTGTPVADETRAQYEAQIAAATERRDLAIRHAAAIRDSLKAGGAVASLAEIRDSVVIGQLLSQQAALDAMIAEKGAQLKANHPTMRALLAQKNALITQINAEAASIAAALEAEAKLDDAQIKLLQDQLGTPPLNPPAPGTPDAATLQLQAAAERAQLDALVDAYFNLKPAVTSSTPSAPAASLLSPLNLLVIGVAFLAAVVFQIALAARRARARREALDMALWEEDHDPEFVVDPAVPVTEEDPGLRRAS